MFMLVCAPLECLLLWVPSRPQQGGGEELSKEVRDRQPRHHAAGRGGLHLDVSGCQLQNARVRIPPKSFNLYIS